MGRWALQEILLESNLRPSEKASEAEQLGNFQQKITFIVISFLPT